VAEKAMTTMTDIRAWVVAILLTTVLAGCGNPTGGGSAGSAPLTNGDGAPDYANPANKSPVTHELLAEPDSGYQPVYDFILGANKTLEMTMYQLSDPKAQDALKTVASRGVRVRVLLDSCPQGGGGKKMNQAAYNDLKSGGVEVKWAWPGTLWHQKSIVRDGKTAAVMTCNLYAPFYPLVRDYAVITNNAATASGMQATFDNDWSKPNVAPTKGVIPAGSELIWSPGARAGLVSLIDSARPGTTLYAEDEQLDTGPIAQALVSAAKRGVTVNVTMTYSKSYVSAFSLLAAGGVYLRLYQPKPPIVIHAKAISVNGDTAYVGSANFTAPMTDQNRNVGIITTDTAVVRGVTAVMADDFAGATPYTAGE
jgi:cardiolipin synthase A/B